MAEYVATLPVNEAAQTLLPHLWYDHDWEYAAPAALAMHAQREKVLHEVICLAVGSAEIPADLSAINAGWAFPGFLARLAEESNESGWSSEAASIIGRARAQLISTSHISGFILRETTGIGTAGGHANWEGSDQLAREGLLDLLEAQANGSEAADQVKMLAQLRPTADEASRARRVVIDLLACETQGSVAVALSRAVAQLHPTDQDKRHVCQSLLRLLSGGRDNEKELAGLIVQFIPGAGDRRQTRGALLQLLPSQTNGWVAAQLAGALAQLSPPPDHRRQARKALLGLLSNAGLAAPAPLADAVAQLAGTAAERHETRHELLGRLAHETDGQTAAIMASTLVLLRPTAEDRDQARHVLLELLAHDTGGSAVKYLADWLAHSDTETEDHRRAQHAQLQLMTGRADTVAVHLASAISSLDPTIEDKRHACSALIRLLASEAHLQMAPKLAHRMHQIRPSTADGREAEVLRAMEVDTIVMGVTALLGSPDPAGLSDRETRRARLAASVADELVSGIIKLDLGVADKRDASQRLLSLLAGENGERMYSSGAHALMIGIVLLATTPDDMHAACQALLGLLVRETDGQVAQQLAVGIVHLARKPPAKNQGYEELLGDLINGKAEVDLSPEDKRKARQALLSLLEHETDGRVATVFAFIHVLLDPTDEDIRRAREALLTLLANATDGPAAEGLIAGIQICPTAEDLNQARSALLDLLERETHSQTAHQLATGLVRLHLTAEEKRSARRALLRLLACEDDPRVAARLAESQTSLDPTPEDVRRTRQTLIQLLAQLARAEDTWASLPTVRDLMAVTIGRLTPTAEDKREVRDALLPLLARDDGPGERPVGIASRLMAGLEHLEPTVSDLNDSTKWTIDPSDELLTVIRRNSTPQEWLRGLRMLETHPK